MNREALIEYAYNPCERLGIGNETYKQWVFRYTFLELEKDLASRGDLTTNLLSEFDRMVTAKIIAKSNGVVAGLDEIRYFLCDADVNFRPSLRDNFNLHIHFQDGANVQAGDVIMDLEAKASSILAVERLVLNLLGRMSGVATNAAKLASVAKDFNVKIAGTRKTLWGLLDKKALCLGGALAHRLNLADAIIVKDTHLDLLGREFSVLFKALVEQAPDCRFVNIEVLSVEEAVYVARLFFEANLKQVGIIMLDNMPPDLIAKVIELVKDAGHYDTVLLEASGGINAENFSDYAKSGVDVISMGCLTNDVGVLDLSLKIV